MRTRIFPDWGWAHSAASKDFMKLGIAPREMAITRRLLLRLITRPRWMVADNDESGLGWFITAEKEMQETGVVVPGVIIQANSLLFSNGDDDHPGELLFTFAQDPDLNELRRTAGAIYDLKGKSSTVPEEMFFSQYLADELERVLKVPVSERITSNPETYVSTTIFYRQHLPDGILRSSVFPVLASPQSGKAMILPHNLWTKYGRATYEQQM